MARFCACKLSETLCWVLIAAVLAALPIPLRAEAARAELADGLDLEDEAVPEDEELASLLALLDEETTIATRTRLNRDFVPGMVSVLRGDMLQALGARNVLDALSLVPGFQVLREANGSGNLSVRGITVPFNAGNTKVLLDSVALSREESGGNSAVLMLPIERVDRIEIMRGPGSSIHGGFAFAGVINVITRQQDGRLFVAGDSGDGAAAGGHASWSADAGRWQGHAGAAWAQHGEDAGPIGSQGDDDMSWVSTGLHGHGLSLTVHHTERDQHIDPAPGIRLTSGERSTVVEARRTVELRPDLEFNTRAAWMENDFSSATTGKRFSGNRLEGEVDLIWQPSPVHRWLFGLEFGRSQTDRGVLRLPAEPEPAFLETDVRDKERRVLALTVQDEISLGENLSAILGVRWDDYSDVDDQTSPRLGLVWRAAERHIVKAQYAEGFRAPTYWEIYPRSVRDEEIGFETMRTAEIGYVYRRPGATARMTLFQSRTDDQIYVILPPPPGLPTSFDNSNRTRSRGIEVEWEQSLGSSFDLLGNLSYVDTWDSRSTSGPNGDSAVAADWIANLAAIWRPAPDFSLALRWLHVGDRHAFSGSLDGYDKVDLTAGWRPAASDWQVELGVRNAFDDPIDYPFSLPFTTVSQHFAPRTYWLRVVKDFRG